MRIWTAWPRLLSGPSRRWFSDGKLLWALALASAGAQAIAALRDHHIDTPQIWGGLKSFLHGASPYGVVTHLPFGYDHPPGSTLIDAPLGLLSLSAASDLIVLVSAATCMLAIFALCGRRLDLVSWRVALAALIISVSRPFHEELTLGNIDLLAMFAMAMGLVALERGRERIGSLLLALGACVKPTAALVLLAPALAKRWRGTVLAVSAVVVITLIGFAVVPHSGRFFTSVVPFLTGPEQGHADYNTSFTGVVEYVGLGNVLDATVTQLMALAGFVALAVRYRLVLARSLEASVALLVIAGLLVPRYSFEVYGLYLVLALPFILKAKGPLEVSLAALAVWFLAIRDVLPLHGAAVNRFRELRPGLGHLALAVLLALILDRQLRKEHSGLDGECASGKQHSTESSDESRAAGVSARSPVSHPVRTP